MELILINPTVAKILYGVIGIISYFLSKIIMIKFFGKHLRKEIDYSILIGFSILIGTAILLSINQNITYTILALLGLYSIGGMLLLLIKGVSERMKNELLQKKKQKT